MTCNLDPMESRRLCDLNFTSGSVQPPIWKLMFSVEINILERNNFILKTPSWIGLDILG